MGSICPQMDERNSQGLNPTGNLFSNKMYEHTGCLKKLSFTDLSIFRFAKNIISISSQLAAGSPDAQFGKTQFFLRHTVLFIYMLKALEKFGVPVFLF